MVRPLTSYPAACRATFTLPSCKRGKSLLPLPLPRFQLGRVKVALQAGYSPLNSFIELPVMYIRKRMIARKSM